MSVSQASGLKDGSTSDNVDEIQSRVFLIDFHDVEGSWSEIFLVDILDDVAEYRPPKTPGFQLD